MTNYKEDELNYEVPIYPKKSLVLVKGKGAKVWDEEGKEYIDCVAGIGVAGVGHCNEKVVDAIKKQSEKLITCPEMIFNNKRAELLKKLIRITPDNLTHAYLCNSGTEAIEAAIKFVRISTKKTEIISAQRGFHGRTLGSLSGTWNKKYRDPFLPLVPGFKKVVYNNIESLKGQITDNTCAILLEIIQGEGGVRPGDKEYFEKVRKICDENNILFIVDEIQTGFGRTGDLFAINHFNLSPDILALGKSIGGGFPIAATVVSDKIQIGKKQHGSTFGGNPLACAAALAAINYTLDNNLPKRAGELGEFLFKELRKIDSPRIREIRGRGLMVGIDLKEKAGPYIVELQKRGILTLLAGSTVIRLLPPLVIEKEDIEFVLKNIEEVLEE